MTEPGHVASIADRELVITRALRAPRELVFRAWTDPEHIASWWGPRGCSAVPATIDMDVRPGGRWRLQMVVEDGSERWMRDVYREVDAPTRLVFTFTWEQAGGRLGNETVVTLDFAGHGEVTVMTLRQAVFVSTEDRQGHAEGWTSSFDCLTDHLVNR